MQDSKYISKILVDTDSPVITEYLAKNFPEVVAMARPEHLLNDPPMTEILVHDTSCMPEADLFFQTHSTNPFLSTETIDGAIERFLSDEGRAYDSLFSVNQHQTRLYDELGRAMNHNPNILLRTQDLPPVYEENSCMYVFPRDVLMSRHSRIGNRAMMYVMENRTETVDIDTMEDTATESNQTSNSVGRLRPQSAFDQQRERSWSTTTARAPLIQNTAWSWCTLEYDQLMDDSESQWLNIATSEMKSFRSLEVYGIMKLREAKLISNVSSEETTLDIRPSLRTTTNTTQNGKPETIEGKYTSERASIANGAL